MDGASAPPGLAGLLTESVARELAEVYDDEPVFPGEIVVDNPDDPERLFPGWPGAVLVLAYENQGVCTWGVPLDQAEQPVLVGGELGGGPPTTVRYAPDVATYVAARRWDQACLTGTPLFQAQAAPLDAGALIAVRDTFAEVLPTYGWPGREQYRYEGDGVRLMLWADIDQCDWWLSASDPAVLEPRLRQLLALSDLSTALWSDDEAADALLQSIRDTA